MEKLFYRDTIKLHDEVTVRDAQSVIEFLREFGTAEFDRDGLTITFEYEAEDLWHACEAAHEIQAELQSRGISYVLGRDKLEVLA